MSKIKMYWWNKEPNFGDALNPHLVEKLSGRKVTWSPFETADIVGAGSLLQWVAKVEDKLAKPLHVWGSGYMFDKEPAITSPLVKYHAVRGHKTKDYGRLDNVVLGDAGLLADLLVNAPTSKKHSVGIVPHLRHLDSPTLKGLLRDNPNIKLIDVRLDPLIVIELIAECRFVLSSSLHGLIVADSFKIPNQWIQFETPLFGGVWKFQDYYSVYNMRPKPLVIAPDANLNTIVTSVTKIYERPGIKEIKKQLTNCFPL